MSESQRTGKCVLCGSDYDNYGHNPQPVLFSVDSRVCDACDEDTIIPVRISLGMKRDRPGSVYEYMPWIKRAQANAK